MNKETIINILCGLIFVCFVGAICYGSYCHMTRVDAMVEQYLATLNK